MNLRDLLGIIKHKEKFLTALPEYVVSLYLGAGSKRKGCI